MFMNLDQVPAGHAMYTLAVAVDSEGDGYDEIDLVAPARCSAVQVAEAAEEQVVRDYPSDARVIGIINQSAGRVMFEDPTGNLRP